MLIGFRVDASTLMGNGHVMRCLTLAYEFKALGYDIIFYCKSHKGNLNNYIIRQGYQVVELKNITIKIDQYQPETWLGCSQKEDSDETINRLPSQGLDWMVIDHYAIEHDWQVKLRPYCKQILVIDDLANRKHDCDLLLDQTLGRTYSDYQKKVPPNCAMLLGAQYILLRREFSHLREKAKYQRDKYQNNSSTSLLITMGASDPENLSLKAINAMHQLIIQKVQLNVTVVLSSNAKHLQSIKDESLRFDWLTLLIDTEKMPTLMLEADISIGASGSTAWERCSLGLPTLSIVCAENQQLVNQKLSEAKAIISLGEHSSISEEDISYQVMQLLSDKARYIDMSMCAIELCDGLGVKRVVSKMQNISNYVKFRHATNNDIELLFSWQSQKSIRRYCNTPQTPSWSEHTLWFEKTMNDKSKELYIIENQEKNKVGMVRLDQVASTNQQRTFEISILVAPAHQGEGIGLATLNTLKSLKTDVLYIANVHKSNMASHQLFINAGFNKVTETSYQLALS